MSNKYLALDDEKLSLSRLVRAIGEADADAFVRAFSYTEDALQALKDNYAPLAAFLDIEMPETTGMELAKQVHELSPETNIIFVTGFPQYALEAYSMHASGYFMKPATAEKVHAELKNLRYPIKKQIEQAPKRIRIQCFGNFEVFADGELLRFERRKTKELLAYLVDRQGAAVSSGELCAVLWEDESTIEAQSQYLRQLMSDLTRTLKRYGGANILSKARNSYAIVPDEFDCDYYDYLNDKLAAINAYRGEYMSQFEWSELTLGALD